MALTLVDLREKSHLQPDLLAETAVLMANELRVLRHQSRRPVDTVWGPCPWLRPRWAGTWAAKGMVHPAGKPAGSVASAGAGSWKAFTWRRNCRTNKTQIF